MYTILFLVMTYPEYGEESITKRIEDEELEFIIPSTYDALKANYIALIEVYIDAETQNGTLTRFVNTMQNQEKHLVEYIQSLTSSIQAIQAAYDAYKKQVMMRKIYVGAIGGYNATVINPASSIVLGGAVSMLSKSKKLQWLLYLPLMCSWEPSLQFGYGVVIGVQFALR
jgi:hypothetical protein